MAMSRSPRSEQRRAPVWARGWGWTASTRLERVAVGADRRLGLGGAQQVGHGLDVGAGLEQVVADAGRGGVQLDQPAGGVAVDAAPPVGGDVVEERVADEPVAEPVAGLVGSTIDAARASSRWSNASSSGSAERATNSSVSNDEPTTATRCSTSRVAGAMPPIMLASRDCTHSGSSAARRASSFGRERDAAAERGDLLDQLGRGIGDVAGNEGRDVVLVEGRELDVGHAVAGDQAVAGLGQGVAQRVTAGGRARCTPLRRAGSGPGSAAGGGSRRRRRARRRW